MKYVLTLCLLAAGIASAQEAAPFNYNAYQADVKASTTFYLGMMAIRDGFGVSRFCGWELTKIVFDGVDSALAKTKGQTGEHVKQVIKDEIGAATSKAVALSVNSGCKDNIQRTFLSMSELIDRGGTAAVSYVSSEIKKAQTPSN